MIRGAVIIDSFAADLCTQSAARALRSRHPIKGAIFMVDTSQIREHMEVIGADGVHVGTVDHMDGDRIKLTKKDSGADVVEGSGSHSGHHHYISVGLVADIEGDKVRLSANAAVAVTFEEEEQQS
jgi:hypothetical protein